MTDKPQTLQQDGQMKHSSADCPKETMSTHYIPIDFNHDSICGLSKSEWESGTNNWDWVNCSACLDRRPTQHVADCGYACDYVEPYGWVPECGCPVHDPDDATAANANHSAAI